MSQITISAGEITLQAKLNDTPTVQAILEALPIEGTVSTWGDEIYFRIPVIADQEPDARADVEVGELGYWPAGPAFCVFFGPTPASLNEKPKAASSVNIMGRIEGNATKLKSVKEGALIRIEKT